MSAPTVHALLVATRERFLALRAAPTAGLERAMHDARRALSDDDPRATNAAAALQLICAASPVRTRGLEGEFDVCRWSLGASTAEVLLVVDAAIAGVVAMAEVSA